MFTAEAWDTHILPLVDQLDGRTGGAVCVLVEVSPMTQNFPVVSVAAFDASERTLVRKAIMRKREKQREAKP